MSTGFLLAVEGTEGAGKSTLVAGLAGRLRGMGVEPLVVREPGGTPAAEAIRGIFLDPTHPLEPVSELYLILAARADLVARVLRPALSAGRAIIADRYSLSTEAYQGSGRGLDLGLVRQANLAATGGLSADLTFVLDLPPEVGLGRIRRAGQALDRIELADDGFHRRVAEAFRQATGPGVVHLDATRPAEQVLQTAWQVLGSRYQAAGAGRGD
jgi:dTMP kinase